jgi:hypothetical protein
MEMPEVQAGHRHLRLEKRMTSCRLFLCTAGYQTTASLASFGSLAALTFPLLVGAKKKMGRRNEDNQRSGNTEPEGEITLGGMVSSAGPYDIPITKVKAVSVFGRRGRRLFRFLFIYFVAPVLFHGQELGLFPDRGMGQHRSHGNFGRYRRSSFHGHIF